MEASNFCNCERTLPNSSTIRRQFFKPNGPRRNENRPRTHLRRPTLLACVASHGKCAEHATVEYRDLYFCLATYNFDEPGRFMPITVFK